MKKLLAVFGVLVFAAFIVAFAASSVNVPTALPSGSSIQADGSPLPLPVPRLGPTSEAASEVADGSPLPLPVPPLADSPALYADGSPLPLPVPPLFEVSWS